MGGLWAVEIPLRGGAEGKVGVQEIKVGGWKEDLARMGFEVPIEEIDKGQIVGQKFLQMHVDLVLVCGSVLVLRKKKKIPSFTLSTETSQSVPTVIQILMLS